MACPEQVRYRVYVKVDINPDFLIFKKYLKITSEKGPGYSRGALQPKKNAQVASCCDIMDSTCHVTPLALIGYWLITAADGQRQAMHHSVTKHMSLHGHNTQESKAARCLNSPQRQ